MGMKKTKRYSVLTKNGFQKFHGVKKTEHETSLSVEFSDGSSIECSKHHEVNTTGDVFTEAAELVPRDEVSGKTVKKVTEKPHPVDLYDLVEVSGGNHYITSGVTSHNCAFIRPTVWEEFADSIFPSQSALAWKKNIIISTANGMNHFYEMVKGAREQTNGMNLVEVDWREVPRFRPDGSLKPPEEFQSEIVRRYGWVYFNQNYGCQFRGSSHTLISTEKLEKMEKAEIQELRDGKLKIYEYPEEGAKYIMTVDPAKDGSDFFAVQVLDITTFTFKQVASAKLQVDYLLMPEFIWEWAKFYNFPYLIIENNEGAGQSIADQMKNDYEYENLHYDKKSESQTTNIAKSKKSFPGFRTTSKSRKQMLQTLKLFIENDKLIINDASTISEFFRFILVNNKYQADDGAHDDMIMSLAMAFVPFCNTKNFEDMRLVVKNLYMIDEYAEDNQNYFADMLTIGTFDDYSDEDYRPDNEPREYLTMEEAMADSEGFT